MIRRCDVPKFRNATFLSSTFMNVAFLNLGRRYS
jgi:hypothetical protein